VIARLDLVEREHGDEMFDAGEMVARRPANALGGGVWRQQVGKFFFERLQLLVKLVVLAISDDLAAFDVICVVVAMDLLDQLSVAFVGGGMCHAEMMARTGKMEMMKLGGGEKA
jgi:hypothetical protein